MDDLTRIEMDAAVRALRDLTKDAAALLADRGVGHTSGPWKNWNNWNNWKNWSNHFAAPPSDQSR